MKNLILSLLFVLVSTSTSFVSAQTYPQPKLTSPDKKVMFQRTSATTATLKFENVNGYIVTEYLKNRSVTEGEIRVITYRTSDGYYIELTPIITWCVAFNIDYYTPLDRKLWSSAILE